MSTSKEIVEWFRLKYGDDTFSIAHTSIEALKSATVTSHHGFPIVKRTVTTTTEATEWAEVEK